uniref:Uncharacterized protein n=1 Tax=Rhizophora mucronata TaxID=61149 RepID=A0A2P2QVH3_RHIMU
MLSKVIDAQTPYKSFCHHISHNQGLMQGLHGQK